MSERTRLAIFLAATLILFAGVALIVRTVTAFDQTRDHASVRTNPWGTQAWRELLEVSGVATRTWRRPLTELTPDVTYLVILDPIVAIEGDEVEAVSDWVHEGGRLVVAPFAYRDASALGGRRAGMSLERVMARFDVRPSTGAGTRASVRPSTDSPLTADVESVFVPTDGRLGIIEENARGADRAGTTVLLTDDEGSAAAVVVSHGDGEAVVLAEAEMLANVILPEADNVVFAANLVFAGGAPETVYFDEYHHGLTDSDEVFAGPEVDVRPFRNTALALLAVGLIYALGRSRRFGAASEAVSAGRRSSAEYVRALAAVHSRAGAASTAASMLAASLRRRAAVAARLPVTSRPEALAHALAARGLPGEEIAHLLERLEQADESMTDVQLLTLAQQVAHYERVL